MSIALASSHASSGSGKARKSTAPWEKAWRIDVSLWPAKTYADPKLVIRVGFEGEFTLSARLTALSEMSKRAE